MIREKYEHCKGDLFGFELKLGNFKTYFFSRSKTLSRTWIKELRKYCISDDFYSKYTVIETLSETSIEKVINLQLLIEILEIEN